MAPQQQTKNPLEQVLYGEFGKNLYRITGMEETESIMDILSSDTQATNATNVQTNAADVGSGSTASANTEVGVTLSGNNTGFTNSTAGGYTLGVDPNDGLAKFYIGNSTSYLNWDGSTLTIVGGLNVSKIDIPDTTTTDSFHVDTDGNMWIGANASNFSSAPFRVDKAGNLTATSATIAGYAPAIFSVTGGTDTGPSATTPISVVHTITHGLGKRPNFISVTVNALDCPVPSGSGTVINYGYAWIFLSSQGLAQGGMSVNITIALGGSGTFQTASATAGITSVSSSGSTSGGTGSSSISVGNVTATTFDITYTASVSTGSKSYTFPNVGWVVYG